MGFFKSLLKVAAPAAGFALGGPLGGIIGNQLTSGGGSSRAPAAAPAKPLSAAAQGSLDTGLSTLQDILGSQGRINPLSRNRALVNVGRGTEAQQTSSRQGFAQRGLQNSGVGSAIDAAIGAAGADRAAGVEANFVQQEEQRKRDDLLSLLQLVINPQIQREGIAAGLQTGLAGINQQRQGAAIGAGSELLSSLIGLLGNR